MKQAAVLLVATACCAAPAMGSEQVLVESKQVTVTSEEFDAELVRIPEESRAEVLASKERIRKLLENVLVRKTLAAQARGAGLNREPALLRQVEMAVDKVLSQAQVDHTVKELKLPGFEVRASELYKIDIEKYTPPVKVHASHILVETKGRTEEEALKRIQEVRAQAVDGKAFDALALEYSDDPSAKQNKGDLGFFEASRMVKPFSDAAFAMNVPGEISEPVKTNFGYHIIQFHEKTPKKATPFEEVKDGIVQGLRDSYLNSYKQNIVREILSDPSIKINEEAIDRYDSHLDIESILAPKK